MLVCAIVILGDVLSCLFQWLSLVPLAFSVLSRRGSIFCTRLHVDYMYYVDNDALRKYMLQYRFQFPVSES